MIKKISFISIVLLFLSGCSSMEQPQAKIAMQSVDYLNPDASGRASPVVVTIYELSSDTAFKNAKYKQLATNPAIILGNKLIDKKSVEIRPAEKTTITEAISSNTKYLGITAAFRNISIAKWKTIVKVPKNSSTVDLILLLESQSLTVKPAKGGLL